MAKHYIITDEIGRVLRGFSDDFEQPEARAICICEDGGRHFELGGIVNPPLINESGAPIYKINDGIVVERGSEEILLDSTTHASMPTIEERTAAIESALLELILGDVV